MGIVPGRGVRAARVVRTFSTAAVGVLIASGCSVTAAPGGPVVVTETVATVTGAPTQGGVDVPPAPVEEARPPTPGPPPAITAETSAAAVAQEVVSLVPGPAGIAMVPVGGSDGLVTAGDWRNGVSWSTIKVPLAVATARWNPQVLEDAATAITVSDNQAAETLWASLGGGEAAAAEVRRVLAEAGEPVPRVPSVQTRAGYSVFGQTQWPLADQARFAAVLPCLGGAGRVVDLMGQVDPGQRWGLGRIPGARIKGGWGPGEQGGYLVRQFGLVPAAGGDIAVAIAVQAPTFEDGTAALSVLADGLAPRLPSLTGGGC